MNQTFELEQLVPPPVVSEFVDTKLLLHKDLAPKIVHKFDDPYSFESILCKDAEWTGYGADNWDKINCPTCLNLRKPE